MGLRKTRYKIRMLLADLTLRIRDKRMLKGDFFDSIIRETPGQMIAPDGTERYAIVAVNITDDELFSLRNLCESLRETGHNVLMISSSPLDQKRRDSVIPFCHQLIERTPVGRDFGSYKIGIEWLKRKGLYDSLSELVLCNDSMYWPSSFGREIERLAVVNAPWKCLSEHVAIGEAKYHAQSYFQIFSRPILNSATFSAFWSAYLPYSDREHAIQNGEVGLSRELLAAGWRPYVLYNTTAVWSALAKRIEEGSLDPKLRAVLAYYDPNGLFFLDKIPDHKFHEHQIDSILAPRDMILARLMRSVAGRMTEANPTHDAAFLCNALFGAPIKRDICFRKGEAVGMVVALASGFSPSETELLQRSLILKGPRQQLGRFQIYLMDRGRM